MSDVRVHRISAFPDGVWWVRWIDGVSIISAMPGTPTVKVVLSPVPSAPAGTVKLVDVAKIATGNKTAEVAIGLIAGLAIGMVFEDGVLVDRLAADERDFEFDLDHDVSTSRPANAPSPVPQPAWWKSNRYDILSASAYPRVLRADSFCAVLQNGFDKTIAIIPAAEVVRAFVAPHSDIATMAFAGPWSVGMSSLVDVEASGIDEDGNWRVVARGKRLGKDMVVPVANLMEPFNPAGFRAASLIHSTLVAKGGRISAALPFEECRLRFRAKSLLLHSGKYLVTEIVRAEWPHTHGIVLVEPGPLADLGADAFQRSYPIDALALPYDRTDPLDVVSDQVPAQSTETAKMFGGAVWDRLPVPEVMRGDVRPRPDLLPIPKPGSVTSAAAVGAPSPRASVAQGVISQGSKLSECARFEAAAAMFDDLVDGGGIVSWRPLPEPGRLRQLGSRDVWAFAVSMPGQPGSWRYVDKARGVLRSAMVCEITLQGGRVAYWIEIEPGLGETFQSLAFSAAPSIVLGAIKKLLHHAVKLRGVWGDPGALANGAGLRDAGTWRHRTLKGGGQNGARALAFIATLF